MNIDGRQVRKGSPTRSNNYSRHGRRFPRPAPPTVERIAMQGGTPLVVAEDRTPLGVIHLKDIVKGGIKERFAELGEMGIKTVMITGDNPLTAAAIAAEAGVDDFLAQATPEAKLKLIRDYQTGGRLVAMTGDGTNDSPALAQADVAVAMNTRHPGGQRGRQHGRSRLESDQTDRDRRDRQAAAHDPRRADHLQHRQRRCQSTLPSFRPRSPAPIRCSTG